MQNIISASWFETKCVSLCCISQCSYLITIMNELYYWNNLNFLQIICYSSNCKIQSGFPRASKICFVRSVEKNIGYMSSWNSLCLNSWCSQQASILYTSQFRFSITQTDLWTATVKWSYVLFLIDYNPMPLLLY